MRRVLVLSLVVLALAPATDAQTISPTPRRLHEAIVAAGVAIEGVSLGDLSNKATWKVSPPSLQSAAQPTIDAFDPNDPAIAAGELDAQVKRALDDERLSAAIVWTILKQMYPSDTDAQTKTKFGVARTRIIDAYKLRPWQ
jgi:hypothetical protein